MIASTRCCCQSPVFVCVFVDFSYVYHSPGDSLDEVLLSVSCVCLFVDFSYVYHLPGDSLDEVLLSISVFVC